MISMIGGALTGVIGYFGPQQDPSVRGTLVEGTMPEERHIDLDVVPRLGKFCWDIVLSPENFPRTVQDGYRLVEKAIDTLRNGINELIAMPPSKRTFDNLVMAYHDLVTDFDAVGHLIRSDYLILNQAREKDALAAQCVQAKKALFSHVHLINVFIEYTKGINRRPILAPVQKTLLKDIILSINEADLSKKVAESVRHCKQIVDAWGSEPYLYLQGSCDTKVLPEGTKALSLFTVNLCLMPKTNSMIYGGVLPWSIRIDAIAEKLKALDADVVCLQEVYDVRVLSELCTRLSSVYAHFYGNVPLKLSGFTHESLIPSSGLALISKFEIHNLTFTPFTATMHEEISSRFGGNYGILRGNIMNEGEALAHLAIVHESPLSAGLRLQQTKEIIALFTEKAQQNADIPCILCGNLNVAQSDPNDESNWFLKMHFIDHYNPDDGPTRDDFGDYWHRKWHGENVEKRLNPKPPATVDRVLSWAAWTHGHSHKMMVKRISMHRETPVLALTDHHGLFASLTY